MDTVTLTAPDISCEHCKTAIEREVGSLEGVHSVSVDIPSKQVQVTFEPARLSRVAIVDTLEDEGYPVSS